MIYKYNIGNSLRYLVEVLQHVMVIILCPIFMY